MKKLFSAAISLAVVAAMSVSAFAVDAGSTNGTNVEAEATVGADGTVAVEVGTIANITGTGFTADDTLSITASVNPAAEDAVAADAVKAIATAIGAGNATVNTVIDISALLGDVALTSFPAGASMTVSVAYDGVSTAAVYVKDDGSVEKFDLTVSEDKTTCEFTVTHFSTFYLVSAAEDGAGDTGDAGNGDDKNQGTGLAIAVIPAAVAAAAVVISKKRK